MIRTYQAATVWLLLAAATVAAESFTFGPHPRLATVETADGAATVTRAQALLAEKIEVPEMSGQWNFYYACPTHNTSLVNKEGKHTCPVCGMVYNDERTQRAWVSRLHSNLDNACVTLAQAWRINGDEAFAREVWRILCRYAELTPGWQRHDRWGRTGLFAVIGGKRYAQSLNDAYGIVMLARAYDLIYDWPGITAAERQRVERDLFRETADSIHLMYLLYDGKNNHMTWYNAAVAIVGAVLGDTPYLERALGGGKGLRWQMANSVTAEGLWYEGTLAYHFYALQAIMITLEAARAVEANVTAEREQTRRMFLMPLTQAYPDGMLPAINDSDRVSLNRYRRDYQQAAAHFDDDAIAGFADGGPLPQRPSEVFPDAGVAYLRQWGENPVTAILDFGQHGGHHGHPDKLNLLFFAAGKEIFPDIGRLTYRCPEYETWTRQTVAHNTVVLGRRSQQADEGKVLAAGTIGTADYVIGESRGAYDGAVLRRALILLPEGVLVDFFRVEQRGKGKLIEWVLHGTSPMTVVGGASRQSLTTPLYTSDGYQHLADVEQGEMAGTVRIVWRVTPDRAYSTWLLQANGMHETISTGTGIGYALTERLPVVIRSRAAEALTVFATVHAPGDAADDAWRLEFAAGATVVSGPSIRVTWDGEAGVTVE